MDSCTPDKSQWGPKELSNIRPIQAQENKPTAALPMAVMREGATERRPCPSSQEASNEEGLFMARKPLPPGKCMAASAPEMWQLKHGPPPKRPRFRPVQCHVEPTPLDLPVPDVPMSAPGESNQVASSCPAYVAFSRASPDTGEAGLGMFRVPDGHQAGTPTPLETLGPIEEELREMEGEGDEWETSDEEGASMDEDPLQGASGMDHDGFAEDDEVFSFEFSPSLE